MTTTDETPTTYTCTYCRTTSELTGMSCPNCGAAVDVRTVVSKSGWVKQPPIRDMAKLKFGQSTAQISGTYVPVVEMNLASGDWIYFSHHVLLHVDSSVKLDNMPMKGGFKRMRAGLPVFMLTAGGPGHIALSFDHPGETIAVPLQPGQTMDVTEHRLLAATGNVPCGYESSNIFIETVKQTDDGTEREWSYPIGQYIDRFTAASGPGLLLVHAPGNVMVRDLAAGESIVTQPGSLVYKDPTVAPSLHFEYPNGGSMFNNAMHLWLRLTGPGRVAISSVFEQPEIGSGRIASTSPRTVQNW
jgi:uncharacterized protein (AIM24 family)